VKAQVQTPQVESKRKCKRFIPLHIRHPETGRMGTIVVIASSQKEAVEKLSCNLPHLKKVSEYK